MSVHEQGFEVDIFFFSYLDACVVHGLVGLVCYLAFAPALGGHAWEHFGVSLVV